jgi:hypothetical protein
MKFNILILMLALAVSVSCKKKSEDANYPTDGLVSYFNLDNNFKDRTGNTPDGVSTNGPAFVTGKRGMAISLDGAGQKVVFSRKTFQSGNNVSVSLWFMKADSSDLQPLVSCSDFVTYTSTSGTTTCGAIFPLTPNQIAGGNFTFGSWTHLVATYDGNNIKVYINGALVQTKTFQGNIGDLNQDLTLGFGSMIYFKGSIDDVFIYNKALTQSEVTQLYNL